MFKSHEILIYWKCLKNEDIIQSFTMMLLQEDRGIDFSDPCFFKLKWH